MGPNGCSQILVANLDGGFLNSLNDDKKVQLFLFGCDDLEDNINVLLFEMALTFIVSSKRFDMRMVQ